jgi:DNA polymerase-3 subunit delta
VIHIVFGADRYRALAALRELRASLDGGDGMLETNTTVIDGTATTPQEVLAHAQAVPFLGGARVVIVEGLLSHIGAGKRARGRRRLKADDDPLLPWRELAAQLGTEGVVPPTTTLVFMEEATAKNAAFALFEPVAQLRPFTRLSDDELPSYVRQMAENREAQLEPAAVAALVRLTGGDLFTVGNELDKLAAYAAGSPIDAATVGRVVPSAVEERLWVMMDAVVQGRARDALTSLRRQLDDGQPAMMLMAVLARQYRQLALVKDMRERRVSQPEVERALDITHGRYNALSGLASRYTWPMVHRAYRILLDADLAVKRGLRDEAASLQLAVHELCALAAAPAHSARAAASR